MLSEVVLCVRVDDVLRVALKRPILSLLSFHFTTSFPVPASFVASSYARRVSTLVSGMAAVTVICFPVALPLSGFSVAGSSWLHPAASVRQKRMAGIFILFI